MLQLLQLNDKYFILNDVKRVEDAVEGAKKYGGSTIKGGKAYCNYNNNDKQGIELGEDNTISLYIPDTMNIDGAIANVDMKALTNDYISELELQGISLDIVDNYEGIWISDSKGVVVDRIKAVGTTVKQDITTEVLNIFIALAEKVKDIQGQEGVTIEVNNGIIII